MCLQSGHFSDTSEVGPIRTPRSPMFPGPWPSMGTHTTIAGFFVPGPCFLLGVRRICCQMRNTAKIDLDFLEPRVPLSSASLHHPILLLSYLTHPHQIHKVHTPKFTWSMDVRQGPSELLLGGNVVLESRSIIVLCALQSYREQPMADGP